MSQPSEVIQVLYEISMSIGDSLDLRTMSKHALSVYLKKLNCIGGIIYSHSDSRRLKPAEKVCSVPRNFEDIYPCDTLLGTSRDTKEASVRQKETGGEVKLTRFDLPKFGTLILASKKPLGSYLLRSLGQVNQKLAHAAITCVQNTALINSELKHRSIFDSIQDVYAEVDAQSGEILEISPSVLQLSGYTRDDLLGKNIVNYYAHPKDRHALLNLLKEKGRANDFVIDLVHKDGSVRNVAFTVHVSQSHTPGRTMLIGTLRDVTHRQITARHLQYRYDYETTIANISTEFAHAPLDALEMAIRNTIDRVCSFTEVDHACFHRDPHAENLQLDTYEWNRSPKTSLGAGRQFNMHKELPWIREKIENQEMVVLHDILNSQELDPEDVTFFKTHEIQSLVSLGIRSGQELFGVLTFYSVRNRVSWTDSELSLFRFASEIIASALSRYQQFRLVKLSQERLQLALEGASLGTWDWDINAKSVAFNDRWNYLLGEDLKTGKNQIETWLDRVHPNDKPRVDAELIAHLEGASKLFNAEHRVQTPSGEWRWLSVHGQVVERDANGLAQRMVGIFSDETDRVLKQQEIKLNEKRLNTILNDLPVGILIADPEDGFITQMNPAGLNLLGINSDRLDDLRLSDVLPPESDLEQVNTNTFNRNLLRPDGIEIPVMMTIVPIDLGGYEHLLHSFVDISAHINAEESLKANLKIKNNFVSNVSHELRTPLASILGFAGTILRDKGMPDDVKMDFIRIIHEESQRLTRLIENVLDIARMEAGTATFQKQSLQLGDLLEGIIETQRVVAFKKNIKIDCDIRDDLPGIYGARDAMSQVLINLISNAVKFTDHGGSVKIRLFQDGKQLVLRVEDNGIGIPREDIPRIFDKFYRVDNPLREDPGTGIGLAIVKEAVQQHDGTIDVKSTRGKGTRFEVRLPVES